MRTALILGISGNYGLQMALALKAQGWRIKALLRDEAKAPQWLEKENRIIGDANEQAKVMAAANGVDLIVYGLNPAYHRWHIEALALLEQVSPPLRNWALGCYSRVMFIILRRVNRAFQNHK